MGGADDRPVWERIAELGFADAVESKGFKRVGKTHWRLDGDGIVHHVKLYRGFSIEPGSFRDFLGIYIPRLDEMCRQVGEPQRSHRVPYGTAPVHFQETIYECYVDFEYRRYQKAYPGNSKARPSFTLQFLQTLPNYNPRITIDSGSGAWFSQNGNFAQLAKILDDSWKKYAYLELQRFTDYCAYYFNVMRDGICRSQTATPQSFMLSKLAGDQKTIDILGKRVFERATDDLDAEILRVKEHRMRLAGHSEYQESDQYTEEKEEIEIEATKNLLRRQYQARKLLRHSDLLGYQLKDPGIDFGVLHRAERDERWSAWLKS